MLQFGVINDVPVCIWAGLIVWFKFCGFLLIFTIIRVCYFNMYNWSVDEKRFKRENPEGYKIWKLEQLINYGEPGEKIDEKMVRKYWEIIKGRIDPYYREFIEFLLWPKTVS